MGRRRSQEISVRFTRSGRYGFLLRWRDPKTGKVQERKAESQKKKDVILEAAELEDQLTEEHEQQKAIEGQTSWSDFCDLYETEYLVRLSSKNKSKWTKVADKLDTFASSRGIDLLTLEAIDGKLLTAFEAHLLRTMSPGSVPSNMATLRAGLSYAVEATLIEFVPAKRRRRRTEQHNVEMRGRPLTDEEVEHFIASTPLKLKTERAQESYQRFMRALSLTGLRVAEAAILSWDDRASHRLIDIDTDEPVFAMTAKQKNRKDQYVAMTPAAAEFFRSLPGPRTGLVLPVFGDRKQITRAESIARTIGDIGDLSGIVTDEESKTFAGAHDFRRTFGLNQAMANTPPIVLMHLMRHASINTTVKFYATVEAKRIAKSLQRGDAGEIDAKELSKQLAQSSHAA